MNPSPAPNSPVDSETAIDSVEIPAIVDFRTARCGPCRHLEPVLADLAERYRGRVQVIIVDVDDEPSLAARYQVRAVPTLLALQGGRVVAQQVGFAGRRPVEELFAMVAAD